MTEIIRNLSARTLFTIATNDESALIYPLPDAIFGFLAHQSCEKLFKALLSAHEKQYPLTHILNKLTRLLEDKCGEQVPPTPFLLEKLQPFAVQLRYDLGPLLSEDDRLAIRETVAILRAHTLTRILALQQP